MQNEPNAPWTLHAFSRLGGDGRPEQRAAAALAELDTAIKSDEPSEEKLKHLLEVRACLAHLSAWFTCAHASRHSSRHRGGHVLGVGLLSVTVD